MKVYEVELKSMSPISFGKFYTKEEGLTKESKETHDDYEKRTWMHRTHVNQDGNVIITPFAFKNCLDSAARYLGKQIPGKGKSTYTKRFVSGCLVLEPLVLPIKREEVKGEWRHVPADGMPGGTKRVMKCFPKIDSWEGKVKFTILDEIITQEILKEHLEQAGMFIGIGSFRPANRGIYGRFKVVSIKEIKSM